MLDLDHQAIVVEVEVFPHPNAERLELARPVGMDWQCVVGKGQFHNGSLAIYVPMDSLVPPTFFEKYLKSSKIQMKPDLQGYCRIRSIRIRQTLSQGLLIAAEPNHELGDNVTEELGIKKYEPPVPEWDKLAVGTRRIPKVLRGIRRVLTDRFPQYTDIQNHKRYRDVIPEGEEVVITEKIHGTNFRCGWISLEGLPYPWYTKIWRGVKKLFGWKPPTHQFVVGSHKTIKWVDGTKDGYYKDDVYWAAAKKYGLDKLDPSNLANLLGAGCQGLDPSRSIMLFGEVYGHKIQELEYNCDPGQRELRIFDIGIVLNDWQPLTPKINYFDWQYVPRLAQYVGLQTVPILYTGPWNKDLVSLADGKTTIGYKHLREGFVVKPTLERTSHCGRVIFKRISDAYLESKGHKTEFH